MKRKLTERINKHGNNDFTQVSKNVAYRYRKSFYSTIYLHNYAAT